MGGLVSQNLPRISKMSTNRIKNTTLPSHPEMAEEAPPAGGLRKTRRRLSVVSDNKLIEGVATIALEAAETADVVETSARHAVSLMCCPVPMREEYRQPICLPAPLRRSRAARCTPHMPLH